MAQVPLQETDSTNVTVPMSVESTPKESHQKGVTQVLTSTAQGRDPGEAYVNAIRSNDQLAMMQTWDETTTQDRLAVINRQLGYLPAEKVQQELTSLSEHMDPNTPIQGNYIETAKTLPAMEFATEDEVTNEAVHIQLRETLAEFTPNFSDMGYGDIAANIGGVLVPKRKGAALTKLMIDMGFIDKTEDEVGAFVMPTDEIVKLRNMFWGLDDAGQIAFMNLLSKHLPNASDNAIIRGELAHNILGGDFNEGVDRIFENLDNFDATLVAGATFRLGKGLFKAGSILNTYKRTDIDKAAEVIETAIKNPEAAAKVGITPADTADAVNPLIHGDVGTLLTGVPEDVSSGIDHMIKMQEATFQAVSEQIKRNGLLDEDGMADAMRAAELEQLRMPGMIESNVKLIDETGFELSWTEAYFDSIGRLRKRSGSRTVDFTVNDIGELKAPLSDWVDRGLTTLDFNARSKGELRHWYGTVVESMARKQETTAKAFDSMMQEAFKDLDKTWDWKRPFSGPTARKSALNVDHALQHGAKNGKTYTYDELVNGVTGRDMSPREAQAYIGVRNVVEKLYRMKNKQIVDNLLANGVKLYDGPEGVLPIRNYATWQAGNTAWKQVGADSHHVLVPDGGLKLRGVEAENGVFPFKNKKGLTKAMIQEAYDKGYVLARNHSQTGLFKKGEFKTQWAFVKAKKVVSPRGQQVIHRIEGYMPKQRTGAYWFIKKNKNIGLSGAKEHKVMSTQAYSDTEEGAKAWIAAQSNPEDYTTVFDRNLSETQRMYDVAATHGGMYSGARKSSELAFVGHGDVTFADSFEAIQHYINHIGRQYPASLYRIGAEQRLVNIARDLGVTGKGLTSTNILARAVSQGMPESSDNYKMLKGIADQINFVNMVPTADEMNMANRWKNVGKFFEVEAFRKIPGWEKVPKYFYQKAAKNAQPQDIIRGLTFNHLLGMYNPAQLIVQYSGALVSFAIDPVGAPKNFTRAWGWTVLDNIASDPIKQKEIIKWMEKNDLHEFAEDYQLWARSGFRETVVQGNADYTSVFTKNLPYDAGILQKIGANHTMFYKMGELANTRAAFSTAVSRYKKAHGVDVIDHMDEKALEEIGMWAEKFRLNMSRANQSALNKGWKAVPFQFQQIISKYFEKILPQVVGGTDEFTSMEKARLAIIPSVATGIVGIPAGEAVLTRVLEMVGVNPEELDPGTTRALKHGVIGWMNSEMLDLNINFSERMTLGGDVIMNIWDSLTHGKMTWQWFGPAGNVADKYYRNMQYMSEAFDLTVSKNEDVTMEDIEAIPAIIFEAVSDIPTIGRNIKNYYAHIMTDNPSFIKDGKYMWDWESMDRKTALFGIMGFQPTEATDMYELNKKLKSSPVEFSTFGDTDADVILRIMNTKLLPSTSVHETAMYARIVNSMIKKYGPAEQWKLMNQIRDKTLKRKLDQDNLVYQMLLKTQNEEQEGLHILNTLVSRKIQERQQ